MKKKKTKKKIINKKIKIISIQEMYVDLLKKTIKKLKDEKINNIYRINNNEFISSSSRKCF